MFPQGGNVTDISNFPFPITKYVTKYGNTLFRPVFNDFQKYKSSKVNDACKIIYTAISRKVVGKDVHGTIPKGNMGYD